jgi:hypothetical protein
MRCLKVIVLLAYGSLASAQPYGYFGGGSDGSAIQILAPSQLQETGTIGFPGPVDYMAVTPDELCRSGAEALWRFLQTEYAASPATSLSLIAIVVATVTDTCVSCRTVDLKVSADGSKIYQAVQ